MKTTGFRQLIHFLAFGAVACTLHPPTRAVGGSGSVGEVGGSTSSPSGGTNSSTTPEANAAAGDNGVPPDTTPSGGSATAGSSGSGGTLGAAGAPGEGGSGDGVVCAPACSVPATCQAGECVCPEGETLCSNACVDVASDANNCGSCGKKCSDGCSAGRCFTTLRQANAAHTGRPQELAINDNYVYYTTGNDASLCRIPRGGGAVEELLTGQTNAGPVALDGTNVYWANQGTSESGGSIQKMPLAGGDPVELASDEMSPMALTIDSRYVYWADYGGPLMKVEIAGGTKTQVTTDAAGTNATNLITDGYNLYWTANIDSGSIFQLTSSDDSVASLGTEQGGVFNQQWMVKIGVSVYFLHFPSGRGTELAKVPTKNNGTGVTPLLSVPGASAIVGDGTAIYVGGANGNKAILKVSLDGVTVSTLANDYRLYRIYADTNDVLWTTLDGDIKVTSKTP